MSILQNAIMFITNNITKYPVADAIGKVNAILDIKNKITQILKRNIICRNFTIFCHKLTTDAPAMNNKSTVSHVPGK